MVVVAANLLDSPATLAAAGALASRRIAERTGALPREAAADLRAMAAAAAAVMITMHATMAMTTRTHDDTPTLTLPSRTAHRGRKRVKRYALVLCPSTRLSVSHGLTIRRMR